MNFVSIAQTSTIISSNAQSYTSCPSSPSSSINSFKEIRPEITVLEPSRGTISGRSIATTSGKSFMRHIKNCILSSPTKNRLRPFLAMSLTMPSRMQWTAKACPSRTSFKNASLSSARFSTRSSKKIQRMKPRFSVLVSTSPIIISLTSTSSTLTNCWGLASLRRRSSN